MADIVLLFQNHLCRGGPWITKSTTYYLQQTVCARNDNSEEVIASNHRHQHDSRDFEWGNSL